MNKLNQKRPISKGKKTGNYYLLKTKKFFENEGWTVKRTEYQYPIPGTKLYRKIDIFGSDLIMMNGTDIVFVNVTTPQNLSKHIHRFEEFPFPDSVKCWIVTWHERAKEPNITELEKIQTP